MRCQLGAALRSRGLEAIRMTAGTRYDYLGRDFYVTFMSSDAMEASPSKRVSEGGLTWEIVVVAGIAVWV